ncbi:UPF0652 protein [Phytophthora citrophthora]|uniref:UPF0652 protein n=1 Tax=Phytophthora citrophthora TaxID=4793 RepID=A0AAD9GUM1_9STRA|nr:UPF0652 protein [Phytophthora citrophthora]
MSSPEAGERLARISRMRTLSALLDDDLDDDEQLPEECRALFAHVTATASKDAKDLGDEDAEQLEQTRRNEFLCVECQAHEAELFCEQCHDYFCELCCGGQHRKGNRRKHTFQPRFPVSKATPAAVEATNDVEMETRDAVDYDVRQCVIQAVEAV